MAKVYTHRLLPHVFVLMDDRRWLVVRGDAVHLGRVGWLIEEDSFWDDWSIDGEPAARSD